MASDSRQPAESAPETVNRRPQEDLSGMTSSNHGPSILHSLFKFPKDPRQPTPVQRVWEKLLASIMDNPEVTQKILTATKEGKLQDYNDNAFHIYKDYNSYLKNIDFQNENAVQEHSHHTAEYDKTVDCLLKFCGYDKAEVMMYLTRLRSTRDEKIKNLDFNGEDTSETMSEISASHHNDIHNMVKQHINQLQISSGFTNKNGNVYEIECPWFAFKTREESGLDINRLSDHIVIGIGITVAVAVVFSVVGSSYVIVKYKQPASRPPGNSGSALPMSETPSDATPPSPPLPHNPPPPSSKGLVNKAAGARQLHTLVGNCSSSRASWENKASILACLDNTSLSTAKGGFTSHASKSNITGGVNAPVRTLKRIDSELKDPRMRFVPRAQKPTPLASSIPHARAVMGTTSIGATGGVPKPTTIVRALQLAKWVVR